MKPLLFLLPLLFVCALPAQPVHKEDRQTIVFRFGHLNIIASNHAKLGPGLEQPVRYQQFPFQPNGFNLYGYFTKIAVTEASDPFLPGFHPTRTIIDTSSADDKLMRLDDLQILISWRRISPTGGVDAKNFPARANPGSFPFSEDSVFRDAVYHMIHNSYTSEDTAAVVYTFRNKRTKHDLLRLNLYGVSRPMSPMLGGWMEDTSATSRNLSLDKYMLFFGYPPNEQNIKDMENETGMELRDERMKSTVVGFYFKHPGARYKDSILEYKLIDGTTHDTGWHTTGHHVLLTNLEHGQHYVLKVRYTMHPGYGKDYSFSISPLWYQTMTFKSIAFSAFVSIGLLIALVMFRRQVRAAQRRREMMSLELKAIRSQLNPHFIFNALNSIQALVNKNDTVGANHYLGEFSKLLRESLLNHHKEMIALALELKTLETYIKLEQLRFAFAYEVTADPLINQHAVEIPALLLQPLVENAIKHGISALRENGRITVRLWTLEKDLLVDVADNGAGFTETKDTQGLGLKLTRQRIELFNSGTKEQFISMQVESIAGTGTTVHLRFENWL